MATTSDLIRKMVLAVLYSTEVRLPYRGLIECVQLYMGGPCVYTGDIDDAIDHLLEEGLIVRTEESIPGARGGPRVYYTMDPLQKLAVGHHE